MIVEEAEYKGHPVLKFMRDEEDKFPFVIGVKKLELIVANLPKVKEFLESNTLKEYDVI